MYVPPQRVWCLSRFGLKTGIERVQSPPPLKQNGGERRGGGTQANRCFAFIYDTHAFDFISFIVVAFTHSCFTKDLIFILLLILRLVKFQNNLNLK